jgi:hypothetical protein
MVVVDNPVEITEQILFDMNQIQPLHPTLIDDHEIPSSTGLTYTTLKPVGLNIPMIDEQTYSDVQPAPLDVGYFSSTPSQGKSKRLFTKQTTVSFRIK